MKKREIGTCFKPVFPNLFRTLFPKVDACISTQLVQLGNIAQRVGHSLQIDPGSGRILNDLEANKLWGREYEKGWEIRV